jgi:opacity protein-like surface antigen
MINFNKLFLPMLLLTSAINADDKIYSFIGIQASAAKYENSSTPTVGLKYGKQSENMRTSISYSYGEKDNNDYQSLIMQIDTGILNNTFRDFALKPYLGASFGVMQHNTKTLPYKDKGFVYGANAGFSYILSDTLDLDLGYRFLKTSKLENIDKINDLTFSMHYFY